MGLSCFWCQPTWIQLLLSETSCCFLLWNFLWLATSQEVIHLLLKKCVQFWVISIILVKERQVIACVLYVRLVHNGTRQDLGWIPADRCSDLNWNPQTPTKSTYIYPNMGSSLYHNFPVTLSVSQSHCHIYMCSVTKYVVYISLDKAIHKSECTKVLAISYICWNNISWFVCAPT